MRLASSLLLLTLPAALAAAQTPAAPKMTAARKPVAHHATAAAAASASTLPPNIPKVPGVVKPLYSLRYTDVVVGGGAPAVPQKFYTVAYTGWLAKDGKKFDSSYDHPDKQPITFPYGAHQVIPGWDTGFEGMHVGGKRRLFIPYQLAYGETGSRIRPGEPQAIPGKSDLIFDIELVSMSDTPPPPPAGATQPGATGAPAGRPNPPAGSAPAQLVTPPPSASSSASKPETDPATNDPAKATTPDNTPKPATPPAVTPKPPTP